MNYADLFNTIFAKDHLVQELGYFFVNEPSVAEFLGKVGVEEAQVQQNIWELRFSNFDESFVLNIYFEGAVGQSGTGGKNEGTGIEQDDTQFSGGLLCCEPADHTVAGQCDQ